ncbi:MAG: peroxiredoxin [Herbinix sp.]|nr:peroxiredoxin [Herbinix sp.]
MEDYKGNRLPMIGDMAPAFHAVTTQGEINFPNDYSGKWVVLFSYQADFTPVCTTELMTFASMIKEFKELDTELIGLSIDSVYSHIAWLRKIRELSWKDIKHVDITFPLIADITRETAEKYAMLLNVNSVKQMFRAVFIIDPEGKIRATLCYPTTIGRNIQEIKRIVMAVQKADWEKAATPADWIPGEDVMLPPPGTYGAATDRMEKVNENMYCLDWFLSFKQSNEISETQENEPEANPFPSAYPTRRRSNNRR